jgi:hypothetical protein
MNPREVSEPGSPILQRSNSYPGTNKRKHEFHDPSIERHRCVIAIQEGAGGIASRTMASTLWTEFENLHNPSNAEVEKKFLIRLAD